VAFKVFAYDIKSVMSEKNKLIKILAVDDVPANLIALEAVFSGTNYKIIEANSGEEALNILTSQHDIALVLLDVQMPDMDGFETASRIKKIAEYEDIPIIFITAVYNEDPFIKKGFSVGAIDYFSKPFDPDILRTKVELYSSYRVKSNLLKEREKHLTRAEALVQAGKKLSSVHNGATIGIMIIDQNENIILSNDVFSEILKMNCESDRELFGAISSWKPLLKAIQGESIHNHDMTVSCGNGEKVDISVSATPLKDMSGQRSGAVLIIQDQTESKKLEQDFEVKLTNLISLGIETEQVTSAQDKH
jgi:CheY-like chemotaxis protein